MLKLLKDAFKVKDIRSRILFTVLILFVFRIGAHVTVPGVDANRLQDIADLPFLGMLNLVSGSAMQNFSIFSMGVSPYITASIIVQLLQMDIVPRFVEWSKQGEVGRKKLNQATRYLTLVLGFLQSMTLTAGFNYYTQYGFVNNPNWKTFVPPPDKRSSRRQRPFMPMRRNFCRPKDTGTHWPIRHKCECLKNYTRYLWLNRLHATTELASPSV